MEMKILNELAGMLEDINPNEIVSHIIRLENNLFDFSFCRRD